MHEQEMTLPKDIANPLRASLKGGGVGGGGDTFHIHALDAKSFDSYLRNGGAAIVSNALRTHHRLS
jgi:hypothetical protein